MLELSKKCAHWPKEVLQPLWGCSLLHPDHVPLLIRQHSWRQVMTIDGAGHHLQMHQPLFIAESLPVRTAMSGA